MAAVAAMWAPTVGSASTVAIDEGSALPDIPAIGYHSAGSLVIDGTGSESNQITVTSGANLGGAVTYTVVDNGAALSAGPGCAGGGAPGVPATCSLEASRQPTCARYFCSNGRAVVLLARLGDGDDSYDSTAVTSDGGGYFRVEIDGGLGADTIRTANTTDKINPGPGVDVVQSKNGGDFVRAEPIADGADVYEVGIGGLVDYSAVTEPLELSLDGVANDGLPGDGDNLIGGLGRIFGGPAADQLLGSEAADSLWGLGGDDHIDGGDGDDALQGGDGSDVVVGGAGDDVHEEAGPSTNDTFSGGPGDDSSSGGLGDDRARGGPGADTLGGVNGEDRLDGGQGADRLSGGDGADALVGGAGQDRVFGFDGSDLLLGGAGADDLRGGTGDHDRDRADCGRGSDRAHLGVEDRERRCEQIDGPLGH